MIGLNKKVGTLLMAAIAAGTLLSPAFAQTPVAQPPTSFPAPPHAAQPTTKKKSTQKAAPKKTAAKKKKKAKKARLSKTKAHAATPTAGQKMGLRSTRDALAIQSSVALVVDRKTGEVLYSKNADAVLPIASLTKLMTALVVVEAGLPMDEVLEITSADVDTVKHSPSRLSVGTKLQRDDMLLLALMSSENRAASALGRHYPGGRDAFVSAMNRRAASLGMKHSHFNDSTGLSASNTSTAEDLVRLANAAYQHPLIRSYSTRKEHTVKARKQLLRFGTSNRLVRSGQDWDIGLQKTGFTNEAGRCLIMQATVDERPLAMVFLDSTGTLTRYGDAARVRQWLRRQEQNEEAYERAIASHSTS